MLHRRPAAEYRPGYAREAYAPMPHAASGRGPRGGLHDDPENNHELGWSAPGTCTGKVRHDKHGSRHAQAGGMDDLRQRARRTRAKLPAAPVSSAMRNSQEASPAWAEDSAPADSARHHAAARAAQPRAHATKEARAMRHAGLAGYRFAPQEPAKRTCEPIAGGAHVDAYDHQQRRRDPPSRGSACNDEHRAGRQSIRTRAPDVRRVRGVIRATLAGCCRLFDPAPNSCGA